MLDSVKGNEVTASGLLEGFGFTGDLLTSRIGDLSGGERRRLQILRLLLDEPNVLLLDEPTNDLDIETLNVIEDYLDRWPGTLIVVSHDRYFLERITDTMYALPGDGTLTMLPRGLDDYAATISQLRRTDRSVVARSVVSSCAVPAAGNASAADTRTAKKDLTRIERQLARINERATALEAEMVVHAADYGRLGELQSNLAALRAERASLEEEWLLAADVLA